MKKLLLGSAAAGAMLLLCGCLNGFAAEQAVPQEAEPPAAGDMEKAEEQAVLWTPINSTASFDAQTAVLVQDGTQTAQMALGDYLEGVVCAEMPALFDEEALKAQAVVARTFALKQTGKHPEGAVCTDPACCQAWTDPAVEAAAWGTDAQAYLEKVHTAVSETDGLVLCYDGELIEATYFSCSGGRTECAQAVWGMDVPYLQSVESPGEENAPRYTGQTVVSEQAFCETLRRENNLADFSGAPEEWIGETSYTEGGGVDTILLGGVRFSGTRLRSLFGLNSTMFTVTWSDGLVTFQTCGYGHRVGMSQYGAQAMAQGGSGFAEILSHYYPGTTLTQQ